MDDDRIRTLLDDASNRYNEGLYDDAIALWREVLGLDPSNQKAREGIRMASLLTADWEAAPQTSAAAPDESRAESEEVRSRIDAGIQRVKELADRGQFAEALEGCELLGEIAPDLDEVRQLAMQVRRAAQAAGTGPPPGEAGIEGHLEAARRALADGRNREAAAAARRALQIDPSNMEACGILSMSADAESSAAPVTIGEKGPPSAFDFETGAIPIGGGERAAEGSEVRGPDAKVRALIQRGEAALAEGKPEAAIEIWSRVFAIDQSNAEAGLLIDRAKAAIEEHARRVDEVYYHAVDAQDAGRFEEALGLFQQVLAISPNHPEARACVNEINARLGGLDEGTAADAGAAREAARGGKGGWSAPGKEEELTVSDPPSVPLAREDLLPAYSPRAEVHASQEIAAVKPAILAPPRRAGGVRNVLVAASGALVVAVAGVSAWLWLGSSDGSMPAAEAMVAVAPRPLRPSSQAAPAAAGAPNANEPIEVVPGQAPKQQEPAEAAQPDPAALRAKSVALTRLGRQFYQQKRWAEAALAFKEAIETSPADFDAQDLLDRALVELEKLAQVEREMEQSTRYFNEGDYASALHKFYRLQQDHPEMRILETYIKNSWFNWGVNLMQSGAVDEAVEKFDEVLGINPRDREASRAREIGKRYHGRSRDAVYDAFTSTLTMRSLDQR